MIALLLAVQVLAVQAASSPGLGTLARQQLPGHGCAAYLWAVADGRLVAMASAEPARLRLSLDGAAPVDLPRLAARGGDTLGLAASGDYGAGGVGATLAMTVATRPDLRDGASVPQATLTLTQAGRDTLVVPLAGLVGCADTRPLPSRR